MTDQKFKPKRLSKKALLQFCDEQIAVTRPVFEGSEEDARQEYEKEWNEQNEKMKAEGLTKKIRLKTKVALKMKYGIMQGKENLYRKARLNFIRSLKSTFGL